MLDYLQEEVFYSDQVANVMDIPTVNQSFKINDVVRLDVIDQE